MSYKTILFAPDGGVLTITLNRPDTLNSITDAMLDELKDAFKKAEQNASVRVAVLTGAGQGFCIGQDLEAVQEDEGDGSDPGYGGHLRKTYNPLIRQVRAFPKPLIGAINGVAADAGMSLALACDVRIAAESASFTQAFVRIGLVPDSGSTWMLPRLIGMARAKELMITGRRITAQQAFVWGLVNQVTPDGLLMEAARGWAEQFAAAPTKAIGYIKRSLAFALENSLEASLEYEADMQDLAGRTADHREGLEALRENRTPKFKGE